MDRDATGFVTMRANVSGPAPESDDLQSPVIPVEAHMPYLSVGKDKTGRVRTF